MAENRNPWLPAGDSSHATSGSSTGPSNTDASGKPVQRQVLIERNQSAAAVTFAPQQAQEGPQQEPYPVHLDLGFDMRTIPSARIDLDQYKTLLSVFPGTIRVIYSSVYMIFKVKTLPTASRWPTTIAGLPFIIYDTLGNGKTALFPESYSGAYHIQICDNLSLAPCADLKTFRVNAQVVATTFRNTFPDVNVLEFLPIICDTIYVVLHDDVDIEAVLDTLPGHIAGLRTLYIHEKFLEKPSTQEARRAILPNRSNGQVDNTEYEILRPGVMLSSPVDDAHVNAFTSGVLIRNGSGDKFMTAPTHAMGSMLNVYSGEGHNPIGQNHSLIPGTDITLVQLASARAFENVTLERPSQDGLGTISTTLRSLIGEYGRPAPTTSRGGFFFDTPYTGTMKAGLFIMRSFTTSDEMMIHNWYYMGQQPSRPYETRIPNGVCGASIFDADGNVWGFFASFIEKGPFSAMCTSLPAEELSTRGYHLV